MEHRPVFRDVNLFPPEHGVDVIPKAGFFSQLQQKPDRFIGDAVLRIIQGNPDGLRGHALPAF